MKLSWNKLSGDIGVFCNSHENLNVVTGFPLFWMDKISRFFHDFFGVCQKKFPDRSIFSKLLLLDQCLYKVWSEQKKYHFYNIQVPGVYIYSCLFQPPRVGASKRQKKAHKMAKWDPSPLTHRPFTLLFRSNWIAHLNFLRLYNWHTTR